MNRRGSLYSALTKAVLFLFLLQVSCTSKDQTEEIAVADFHGLKWGDSAESASKKISAKKDEIYIIDDKVMTIARFFLGKKSFHDVPVISIELQFDPQEKLTNINYNMAFPNKFGGPPHFNKVFGTPKLEYSHIPKIDEFVENYLSGDRRPFKVKPSQLTKTSFVWTDQSTLIKITTDKKLVKVPDQNLMGKMQLQLHRDKKGQMLKKEKQIFREAKALKMASSVTAN